VSLLALVPWEGPGLQSSSSCTVLLPYSQSRPTGCACAASALAVKEAATGWLLVPGCAMLCSATCWLLVGSSRWARQPSFLYWRLNHLVQWRDLHGINWILARRHCKESYFFPPMSCGSTTALGMARDNFILAYVTWNKLLVLVFLPCVSALSLTSPDNSCPSKPSLNIPPRCCVRPLLSSCTMRNL